jgi:pseudouridine-5'-phosphate glycosidase
MSTTWALPASRNSPLQITSKSATFSRVSPSKNLGLSNGTGMTKPTPKDVEVDPREGDAILKRMLQMKPKPHKEMVKGRASKPKGGKDARK